MNKLPFKYDDDESITGAINWIYGNGASREEMAYLVADLEIRLGKSITSLEQNSEIHKDYRATSFDGNTSQVIVMSFDPPKCLRTLHVNLRNSLTGIPAPLTSAIPLSDLDLILVNSPRQIEPPVNILGPEPPHGWCYYFQKADLARQQKDWVRIAELGDTAFALGDRPNDASERLPFIEGYAHVGRWGDAIRRSFEVVEDHPEVSINVCRTWLRLEQEVLDDEVKESALNQIYSSLRCDELREQAR